MKKLISLLVISAIFSFVVIAQSPNLFNYQAVLRDSEGNLIADQDVVVEIAILHATPTGAERYTETFDTSTDQNGVINLVIGTGTTNDDFLNIDWSEGTFYLQVKVNGEIIGATQLLSVPYAKFADEAGNVFSGDYNDLDHLPNFNGWDTNVSDDFSGDYSDLTNAPVIPQPNDTSNFISISNPVEGDLAYYDGSKWITLSVGNNDEVLMIESGTPTWKYLVVEESVKRIGEFYLGGIIFYVSPDGQHGLVASLNDLDDGEGVGFSDITSLETNGMDFSDGSANTDSILLQGALNSAAQLCVDLGPDWYLPAARELHLLHIAAYEINRILESDGDSTTNGITITVDGAEGRYWSSTEISNNRAWCFLFNYGYTANNNKSTPCRVRAIKSF